MLENILYHTSELLTLISLYIQKTETYNTDFQNGYVDDIYFKGIVLSCVIDSIQYKQYIYSLLKQNAIDPNVTLSNFYQIATKKILLNFNCVKMNDLTFTLVNRYTKPNMPLWVALMGAASYPYLQGQFFSKQEWQNVRLTKKDPKIRMAQSQFANFKGQ